ncbi:hypothetical protein AGR7B_Cc180016 [Agrobacterium deltaense RV3]|nr:hypothetical protein AGR7B_Cc180016 [Agrobacterium deltaense RV3]
MRISSGFIGASSISGMSDIYIDHHRYTSHVSVRIVCEDRGGGGHAFPKKKAAGYLRGLISLKVKTSRGEQLPRALSERDS